MSKIVTLEELVEGASDEKTTKSDIMKEIRKHFPDTKTNKDLLKDKNINLSWLVDGLLLEGGTSIVAAEPKTGKSVFARQIAFAVSRGHKILNRKVKRGLVFYISVEDHPALIKKHMKSMGVKDDEEGIIWSLGKMTGLSFTEGIEFLCKKIRPSLIVIDTLFKILRAKDINDYNAMIDTLQGITDIARKYKTHIMYIHHLNKGGSTRSSFDKGLGGTNNRPSLGRIMGSIGIAGEMDNIIFLSREGDNRFLDSSFSRTGKSFNNELLFWDEKKGIYLTNDI